ncbi:protein-disulfide reductase DsbD domain-containing protein [Celeribacter arenosi]|uniref:Protein-disulfide reductase DsbD family protein n=1 Tax=Celeribacter arenosi TaxID=792649 RepID=A0ABP7K0C7_9RHOB
MHHDLILRAIAALTLSFAPMSLTAQSESEFARIEMLTGWQMENGNRMAAVRVALAPGWHTYWRAPGEAGIPPRFFWSGSQNVAAVRYHWPIPQVYEQNGMTFIGYEDELVLPIEIIPRTSGDIRLSGVMELGVCDDICMPLSAPLSATFDDSLDSADTAPIQKSLRSRPVAMTGVTCAAEPVSDGMRVKATMSLPSLGIGEMAVIEHPDPQVWVAESTMERTGTDVSVTTEMVQPDAQPFAIERSSLIITVLGNGQAYEARGCRG